MSIAKNLKLLRRLRGLTLETLSKKANISISYLSRLESGNRKVNDEVLTLLSAALDCDESEIIGEHPPRKQLSALGLPSFTADHPSFQYNPKDGQGLAQALFSLASRFSGGSEWQQAPATDKDLPVYKQTIFDLIKKGTPDQIVTETKDLPVPEQVTSGQEHHIVNIPIKHPVDWVGRPPELRSAPEAFGFYVTDIEVSPKYALGDILLVHPGRPITPGCSVLAVTSNDQIIVRKFIGWKDQGIILSGFTSESTVENASDGSFIPLDNIKGVYRIIGTRESVI